MDNPELELAWRIIANTDTHLFLTGKAGTGKTTFLHTLKERLPKRMVVVAPTGIAAINAKGVTIHSFFQLGFGPQIPGTKQGASKKYQFRKNKLKLIRSIDLVVIDEVSMVRADVLDAIDGVLRQYRNPNRPFGGVQMLMIGDMQQLAPVAKEEEWRLLSPHYSSPYFFSSKALQSTDFVTIELKKVYRQSDPLFLDILNQVRTNTIDAATLARLNERYLPDFVPDKKDGYIQLTTHNRQADAINQRELEALTSHACHYQANVDGDFPEMSYPTDSDLILKVGAQVMFVKNDSSRDKAYYNGMIGEVVNMNDKYIEVLSHERGVVIKVGHEKWENTQYVIDEKTKEIEEKIIGIFAQFPLKTAWAITVHKSQGLTFEHAIINVQNSFAHGQTYVALSRCKTLEGLVLSNPIPASAIINDSTVQEFSCDARHQAPDAQRLDNMERKYMLYLLDELFGFNQIRYNITDMIRLIREHFLKSHPKLYTSWNYTSDDFKEIESVSARFHKQYSNMVLTLPDFCKNEQLQERITKGAEYFGKTITFIGTQLEKTKFNTENKQLKARIANLMQSFKENYTLKVKLLEHVSQNGLHICAYLQAKAKIDIDIENVVKQIFTDAPTVNSEPNTAQKELSPMDEPGHVEIDELPY